jgi:cell wall-associated NlpC family hydrolase
VTAPAFAAPVVARHGLRVAAAGAAALAVCVVALTLLLSLLFRQPASRAAVATEHGAVCATSGPLAGLTGAQAQAARTVVATATPLGGRRTAVIAVMVALAESELNNIDHGDRDSVGLFQQRGNWGSEAQRMDPVWATTAFLSAPGKGLLVRVPGWASLLPWVAAQDTQVSAWDGQTAQADGLAPARDALTGRVVPPDGYGVGANYEAQFSKAQTIVAEVNGDAVKRDCGGIPHLPGDAARHGLPSGFDLATAGATPAEATAIRFALAQLDKPYVFAAAGPDAFDCSGLTMAAWAQAGVGLPHWTVTQALVGAAVTSRAAMSPGDLILVPGSDGTLAVPGHVGMYIGHGLVVDAADEQLGIIVQTFDDFVRAGGGLSAIRHVG